MVRKKGLIAVVADKEWNAIRAAQQLKVTWSEVAPAFPRTTRSTTISARRRCASARSRLEQGDVEQALAGAARIVEAEYEWPFQSHSSMGPACAVC